MKIICQLGIMRNICHIILQQYARSDQLFDFFNSLNIDLMKCLEFESMAYVRIIYDMIPNEMNNNSGGKKLYKLDE